MKKKTSKAVDTQPRKLNRIKEILARDGVRQNDLAVQIKKSRVVTTNYVNNKKQPSLEVLFQIAEVLKVDPKELINSPGAGL